MGWDYSFYSESFMNKSIALLTKVIRSRTKAVMKNVEGLAKATFEVSYIIYFVGDISSDQF